MSDHMMSTDEPTDGELGREIESFVPSRANLGAGFILAVAAILGGLAFFISAGSKLYRSGGNLPMEGNGNDNWAAVCLFLVLGTLLIFFAFLFVMMVRRMSTQSISICERGFRYCQSGKRDDVAWTSVRGIRKTILYERPPILKGPAKFLLPTIASTSYEIFVEGESSFTADGNLVKDIKRFGDLIESTADRSGINLQVIEEHPRI